VDFTPPNATERLKAIGSTAELPERLQRAFDPSADFAPVPKPGPHDWLANHPEPGQSFEAFRRPFRLTLDKARRTIYLQPLGRFEQGKSPSLETLRRFAAAYFPTPVAILPSMELSEEEVTTRINPYTGKRQLLASDILKILARTLPHDAFCVLGIAMEDLYPEPSWNFVFGLASPRQRAAVYSFARYDPAFYGEEEETGDILLRRSCKVVAHEVCHLFGLDHCIYFNCIMNGSNHLAESDARPFHLCPVCLRKLHHTIEFDLVKRYQTLKRVYEEMNFHAEAEWVARRLQHIGN